MGSLRRAGDGAEMLEQALLRRLVVIRRDLQRAVRAGFLRVLREIDRFLGGIRARAREDLDSARGEFHRQRDDLHVLLVIDRGRFAGGADGHDAVHSALDLHFDKAFERGPSNWPFLNGVTMAV